jgi:hypothetical protein
MNEQINFQFREPFSENLALLVVKGFAEAQSFDRAARDVP